jgi:hypothetical protein
MIEQHGPQAADHGVDYVLSFFFRGQRQSTLNPTGQLISTPCARSHLLQVPFQQSRIILSRICPNLSQKIPEKRG